MGIGWSAGAVRALETLLKLAGGAAVLRFASAGDGPVEEVRLTPVLLRVSGDTAEMLVSAEAMRDVGGASLEMTTARVVAGEKVWRVVGCSAVECGGVHGAWRVSLVR